MESDSVIGQLKKKVVELIEFSKMKIEDLVAFQHFENIVSSLKQTNQLLDQASTPANNSSSSSNSTKSVVPVPPSIITCVLTYSQLLLVKLSTRSDSDKSMESKNKQSYQTNRSNLFLTICECVLSSIILIRKSKQSLHTTNSSSYSNEFNMNISSLPEFLEINDEILWRLFAMLISVLDQFKVNIPESDNTINTATATSNSHHTSPMSTSSPSSSSSSSSSSSDREIINERCYQCITEIALLWKDKYIFLFSNYFKIENLINSSVAISESINQYRESYRSVILKIRGPFLASLIQSCLYNSKHPAKSLALSALTCLSAVCEVSTCESDWRIFIPGIFSGLYSVCTSGYKR